MMKLLTVKINVLQILLFQTKLILVSLTQFLICLMTRTKVNLVSNLLHKAPSVKIIQIYSQLTPIILKK